MAVRYARRLRVAHLFERKWLVVGYLAAVAACSLLYGHPVGRYAWAADLDGDGDEDAIGSFKFADRTGWF